MCFDEHVAFLRNKILPEAVTGLSVTFLNKRANLSWTATAGAEHYIIEQKYPPITPA